MVMIVCNSNTVRESSHIFFSCGRDPYCEVIQRPENTHEELTGLIEWPAGLSLRLREQRASPLRLRDQRTSPLRLSDHWISAFSPELQTLYCLFKSHTEVWTFSLPHVYFCGWLSELTYFRFFAVICWSYLRTKISVTLSIGNKLYSSPSPFIFSFQWPTLLMIYYDRIESANFIVAS